MAADDICLFNIRTVDSSGEEKLTNRISTEAKIDQKATLGTIRNILASEKKLDSEKARLSFCGKDGDRIGDDMSWSVYQKIIKADKKDDSKDRTNEPKETTNDPEGLKVYDVYFEWSWKEEGKEEKKKNMKKELSASAQKVLDGDLDLDLTRNKPELITATLKELASKYTHANFKAGVSKEGVVVASSMSEENWETVLRNTQYLNGHRIVFFTYANGTKGFKRIDKAPYTAFSIIPRKMTSMEKADKNIRLETEYRIPRYVVTDDSYVNVFETATALSKSVASSSFSQLDIEASAGGNLFGASMSAKAGFSESESQAVASSSSSSTRTMNITYNFPRVILHLDPRSVELTDECKIAVEEVKDEESLVQFHHDYGHFFATNIQLGGKLFASEQFTSAESAKAEEKANAMKASAQASFSYNSFQASASVSYETNENKKSSSQRSGMSNSLTWEAQGGDTILCNDPPNWCHTVKPFDHWRVVNQQDVMPLVDFIGSFPGYRHIPGRFERIVAGTRKLVGVQFRLRANEGKGVSKDQFFGVRRDARAKRLEKVMWKYQEQLRGVARKTEYGLDGINVKARLASADKFHSAFYNRVKGEAFTNGFEEHVGIGEWSEGCDFEIEALSELKQIPKLKLNVPYLIRAPRENTYLTADTSGSYQGTFFGYMYYARKSSASKFMFRKVGARNDTGDITDGAEVELTLCDDTGKGVGVVERFGGDSTTLMVSKFGVEEDLATTQNSKLEYIKG